jgi:hypothetical protein
MNPDISIDKLMDIMPLIVKNTEEYSNKLIYKLGGNMMRELKQLKRELENDCIK